ncbi:lymphocyte antigen 6D [Hippoglossus hippoglossus]|uniref:lymphocyte antigen 6D n=1 Tax=Hippoglossus hippoglossus TaxID=8267 RepID=UPI00148E183E|nr:lymphocyte antigen 6D [Hippoglossus hippoglossus]
MKVLFLTLLLLLVCSTQVLTLRCNTCTSGADVECKTPVECELTEVYCRTVMDGDQMDRTCEQFCDPDDFTSCCQTDEC